MHVELLGFTPSPERAIAVAARLCYSSVGGGELSESLSDEGAARVLSTILGSGHYSALEHASYTFSIEGVSRVLTHQLVRHRVASFNQQSQRYVEFKEDGISVVKPGRISEIGGETEQMFDDFISRSGDVYRSLIDAGVPVEDARYVLPGGVESKIVVTMNARELLHFFSLRCCNRAQWEIRDLAHAMLNLVRPTAPLLFAAAGAPCVNGPCPEGKMRCGNPYPRVEGIGRKSIGEGK